MRLLVFLFTLCLPFSAYADQACDTPRSSADVMRCLTQQNQKAEADLNKAYGVLSLQSQGDGLKRLENTQKQWLMYRDLECAMESDISEKQSLNRLENLRCLNRLTEERVGALEYSLKAENDARIIGEVSAQPRWMNALASDYPNVLWRYNDRIEGDFDCDGDAEYVMSGLQVTIDGQDTRPVVMVSENPEIGRPMSSIVSYTDAMDDPDSGAQSCGKILDLKSVESLVGDGADTEADTAGCSQAIGVSAQDCPMRLLRWTGEAYGFDR